MTLSNIPARTDASTHPIRLSARFIASIHLNPRSGAHTFTSTHTHKHAWEHIPNVRSWYRSHYLARLRMGTRDTYSVACVLRWMERRDSVRHLPESRPNRSIRSMARHRGRHGASGCGRVRFSWLGNKLFLRLGKFLYGTPTVNHRPLPAVETCCCLVVVHAIVVLAIVCVAVLCFMCWPTHP